MAKKTLKDLKAVALDLYKEKILTSQQVPPEMLQTVFLPLALCDKAALTKMRKRGIVVLYEYLDKAGPLYFNGYPTFVSCHGLTKKEWNVVLTEHEKLLRLIEPVRYAEILEKRHLAKLGGAQCADG